MHSTSDDVRSVPRLMRTNAVLLDFPYGILDLMEARSNEFRRQWRRLGVQLSLGWEIAGSRGSLEEQLEIHNVSS